MPAHPRRGRLATVWAIGAATAVALAACSSPSGSGSSPSASSSSSSSTSAAPAPAPSTKIAAAAACPSGSDPKTTFKLGTFLPLTGSLAFLAPAAIGGSGLALQDINAAGGVNGQKACSISVDSSDADNPTIGSTNVKKLLQARVSAILGAESSSVTESVLPTVSASNTVMFSPANTDDALSGASKWYFRDAAPNKAEGDALGKQIVADGNSKVAILVFNDAYGTNLRDSTQAAIEANGGTVVYGAKGKNQEFSSKETNFSSEVQAALAAKPDAVVIIAFDQTTQIVPALVSAGFKMPKAYFVDGNLNDYTGKLPANTLNGAQGTAQGVNPNTELRKKIQAWYSNAGGGTITSFGYGAESYDATTLLALAAVKGGDSSSATIQANLLAVSGANGGTVCKSYKECVGLLKQKKAIHYEGLAGIGPLNDKHDPSTGYVSVYRYKGNNPTEFVNAVKGGA
ncbi:ABC transporter substrate-binding protein [Amnibacterium sp. CER49]|uniref:ABC transporter substrate-binding protein n=1 Tax=Amnibacterium sp. CER49 TaxID=3039161 RepID=UPI002446B449|nr:ABC transporter substrate-binding protein [Amnibacterium sp. CER49]MDH2443949.1 ABC transporter substrate-binding protein [Amnibacterium sp. CER49]